MFSKCGNYREKKLPLAEKKVRADSFGFFGSFGFNNTAQRPPLAGQKLSPR